MPPFVNGLLFGLIFLFALGPALFALIQTGVQQGFRKAVFFAIGISVSDITYVMIILFGTFSFLESDQFKFWMAVFGSIMLTSYSVYSWIKKPIIQELEVENEVSFFKYFIRGFLLNGLNPFIIVFWATWISAVTINFDYGFKEQIEFFLGMLLSIISSDIGKSFLAHRLKHLMTVKFLRIMNRTVAIITLIFALRIVYFIIWNFAGI